MNELAPIAPDNDELSRRQAEFAALLGLEPAELAHLRFCPDCHGHDYQWTDVTFSNFADEGMVGEADINGSVSYREYLASKRCGPCDGTGFEKGSFQLLPAEWVALRFEQSGADTAGIGLQEHSSSAIPAKTVQ